MANVSDGAGDGDGDGDGDGLGFVMADAEATTAGAGSPSIAAPRHSTIVAADAAIRHFMSQPPPRAHADARGRHRPVINSAPAEPLIGLHREYSRDTTRPPGQIPPSTVPGVPVLAERNTARSAQFPGPVAGRR